MSRDSNGNYSLPSGNPVVTGEIVSTTWANPTMADLANEITNSLDRQGRGGMLAPFKFADGAVAAPAMSFTSEPTLGFYRHATQDVRAAVAGTARMRWTATGVDIWNPTLNAGAGAWTPVASSADVGAYLPLAGGTVSGTLTVDGELKVVDGNVLYFFPGDETSTWARMHAVPTGMLYNTKTVAHPHVFYTGDVERFRIVDGLVESQVLFKAPGVGSINFTAKKIDATSYAGVRFHNEADVAKWWLYMEGNTNDDLILTRYNDAGTWLQNALTISNLTGDIDLAGRYFRYNGNEVGYKNAPLTSFATSASYDVSHCGTVRRFTGGASQSYTMGPAAYSGDTVTIINESSGPTLAIASGGYLNWYTGSGVTQTAGGFRTLAKGGVATLVALDGAGVNNWAIWGSGLS